MKISIIAAMDEKRGVGKDNRIPWHISEDLKRFKAITTGHAIIMGRKTFDSLEKPLSNRYNIVITRDEEFKFEGVSVCYSLEEAIQKAMQNTKYNIQDTENEVFIIGGGQIFKEAMEKSLVNKLYLTIVKGDFDCDTFFPEYSEFDKIISEQERSEGKYKFKIVALATA